MSTPSCKYWEVVRDQLIHLPGRRAHQCGCNGTALTPLLTILYLTSCILVRAALVPSHVTVSVVTVHWSLNGARPTLRMTTVGTGPEHFGEGCSSWPGYGLKVGLVSLEE